MSNLHERPGVYSVYDTSSVVSGGRAVRTIGVAAKAARGDVDKPVTVTGWTAGVSAFGEDETAGMSTILRLLFENGASAVTAVRVAEEGTAEDYARAFAVLGTEDAQVLVCDSGEEAVHQALRSAVEEASGLRHERIAVVGCAEAEVPGLVERAAELNSERVVLVGPDALDSAGKPLSGVFAAAAVASAIAASADPAVPLNGCALRGLGGVSAAYGDNEVDLLVRGGVTPLEAVGGEVSPVRGITTRTTTGGVKDATWRELTTILIVDNVIPAVRSSLRSRFRQAKNTVQTRGAVRSQVIMELENRLRAQIIDSYGEVTVSAAEEDPTVCLVEFSFAVAHGLNQIVLTAHITI